MIEHVVEVQRTGQALDRERQLAWHLAEVATDPVEVEPDVEEMLINRVIDNAAVALASLNRRPVANARAQALRHPASPGASVFGATGLRVSCEWAAWANATAVRELDFHDTFLAAEYAHPADNISPVLAVAQHCQLSGEDLIRGLAAAYEIQINLARGICLHEHKVDHVAHLGPSVAAGIGAALRLPTTVVYQAIQQALHTTTTTRQSSKGDISSWKAYAPAFAGKLAVEAVDRAMRGESSPSPIYEGADGLIAWFLGGPAARYTVPLPSPGEPKRAILESYTKEYCGEYQSQAFIDLARRLRSRVRDTTHIKTVMIHTSHHTHHVIGSGAHDPEKYSPTASRETLDHSLMYIFAVALQDGTIDCHTSYTPERASRPDTVALWRKISTLEDPKWTQRYHSIDPLAKAFGGHVVIEFVDGTYLAESIAIADAHPLGARPFTRERYIEKFKALVDDVVSPNEQTHFLATVQHLAKLNAAELDGLFPAVNTSIVTSGLNEGLF